MCKSDDTAIGTKTSPSKKVIPVVVMDTTTLFGPNQTNNTKSIGANTTNNMNTKSSSSSSSMSNTTPTTTTTTTSMNTQQLPFYRSGGMMINLIGMVFNIAIPLVVLTRNSESSSSSSSVEVKDGSNINTIGQQQQQNYFIKVLLISYLIAAITTSKSKTTYCIFVVPTYLVSIIILPMIVQSFTLYNIGIIVISTAIIASIKINICMSVCMHRYASHAAFKCCHPIVNIFLCILSCFANQGGPLWWSSQHRCHHKYCELPRDPHSPKQVGTERAFGFFLERFTIEEEFVPKHILFPGIRILDSWAFLIVSFELWFVYTFCGGNVPLFIAYTSSWLSQTISLWFNIANHPIIETTSSSSDVHNTKQQQCTASDYQAALQPTIYIPFYILDALVPLYSWLAMEDEHEHHHNHANLAKRSPYDIAYWTFIKPLEEFGLIWNVVVK